MQTSKVLCHDNTILDTWSLRTKYDLALSFVLLVVCEFEKINYFIPYVLDVLDFRIEMIEVIIT